MTGRPQSFGNGRYIVTGTLGAGGMGQVYEVRIVATGGRAAVKTLRASLAEDRDHLERFRREATAMGTLEHPHIVRSYDFALEPDGSAYLVMELLEGRSLHAVVAAEGALAVDRAVRLGMQICSALTAAHAAGIIHRDIKPSNVVLVPGYDGREIAKVIDFGIASMKETSAYERLTRTGQILGTPAYMAPEQLGGGAIGPHTDVYAVGALLYALLAGRAPYPGKSLDELLPAVLAGDRPPLRILRPAVGPLGLVIDRAMAIEPSERFASMTALRDALARHENVATPPSTDVPRAPVAVQHRPTRPRARWPLILLALLVPMLALAGVLVLRPFDTPTHIVSSPARPQVLSRAKLPEQASPLQVRPVDVRVPALDAGMARVVPQTPVRPVVDHPVRVVAPTSPVQVEAPPTRPRGFTIRVTKIWGDGEASSAQTWMSAHRANFDACARQYAGRFPMPVSWTADVELRQPGPGAVLGMRLVGVHSQAETTCAAVLVYPPPHPLINPFSGRVRIDIDVTR